MGRGRSKAKQTRVARDLKYHSQDIDIERLAKELHGEVDQDRNDDDYDPYAEGNYVPRKWPKTRNQCELLEYLKSNQ